ncbi:hypothetical protein [Desertimonas flava]|uniref:hypothetical protein n=1 Tax=Desertimonas flava TaxID=2064846 RepID=UPI000E3449C6|nr:hypothetical protein [Desertimonas flava]
MVDLGVEAPSSLNVTEMTDWLDTVAAKLAAAVSDVMGDMVNEAFNAAAASPVATAASVSAVSSSWSTYVTSNLAPTLAVLFSQAGQIGFGRIDTPLVDVWGIELGRLGLVHADQRAVLLNRIGRDMSALVRAQTAGYGSLDLGVEVPGGAVEAIHRFARTRGESVGWMEAYTAGSRGVITGQRVMGPAGAVEKEWIAVMDSRTRPTHSMADSQTVLIGEQFQVGVSMMDGPHDPSAPSNEVMGCRCQLRYLYPGDRRRDGTTVARPTHHDV